jgi:predicted DNA-binding transcriptional regulator YafY
MEDKICKAIKKMKRVKIKYRQKGKRIIEPHAFGYDRKNQQKLRAFQVSGYSHSGNPTGWKLFIVNHISEFEILNEHFSTPREGYNPSGDKMIPHIICKL